MAGVSCVNEKLLAEFLQYNKQYAVGGVAEYIEKVRSNPTFIANPASYMKEWIKKRGTTEELRVPEDWASRGLQYALGMTDIDGMALKVKKRIAIASAAISVDEKLLAEFLQRDDRYEARGVPEYIEKVRSSPDFIANPGTYIKKWIKKRGKTEELRFAEDWSLQGLQYALGMTDIDGMALKVKKRITGFSSA